MSHKRSPRNSVPFISTYKQFSRSSDESVTSTPLYPRNGDVSSVIQAPSRRELQLSGGEELSFAQPVMSQLTLSQSSQDATSATNSSYRGPPLHQSSSQSSTASSSNNADVLGIQASSRTNAQHRVATIARNAGKPGIQGTFATCATSDVPPTRKLKPAVAGINPSNLLLRMTPRRIANPVQTSTKKAYHPPSSSAFPPNPPYSIDNPRVGDDTSKGSSRQTVPSQEVDSVRASSPHESPSHDKESVQTKLRLLSDRLLTLESRVSTEVQTQVENKECSLRASMQEFEETRKKEFEDQRQTLRDQIAQENHAAISRVVDEKTAAMQRSVTSCIHDIEQASANQIEMIKETSTSIMQDLRRVAKMTLESMTTAYHKMGTNMVDRLFKPTAHTPNSDAPHRHAVTVGKLVSPPSSKKSSKPPTVSKLALEDAAVENPMLPEQSQEGLKSSSRKRSGSTRRTSTDEADSPPSHHIEESSNEPQRLHDQQPRRRSKRLKEARENTTTSKNKSVAERDRLGSTFGVTAKRHHVGGKRAAGSTGETAKRNPRKRSRVSTMTAPQEKDGTVGNVGGEKRCTTLSPKMRSPVSDIQVSTPAAGAGDEEKVSRHIVSSCTPPVVEIFPLVEVLAKSIEDCPSSPLSEKSLAKVAIQQDRTTRRSGALKKCRPHKGMKGRHKEQRRRYRSYGRRNQQRDLIHDDSVFMFS